MCIVEGDLNFLAPAGRHVYSNSQLKLYRLAQKCQRKTVGSRDSKRPERLHLTCIFLLDMRLTLHRTDGKIGNVYSIYS